MSDLLIRNDSIQSLYGKYCDNVFIVNRKYQRKLVWELEEKKNLINSIISSYPIPLFLLASVDQNGKDTYEIIDGMQRLEAIFSFIENKYPVLLSQGEGFFDLDTLAKTKELRDMMVLKQKSPILPRDLCVKFVEYQLALSVTNFEREEAEEIFRRINSSGRRLSSQDLRQAGAIGDFSDIVRKISSLICRDFSPSDTLLLSNMREISLSSKELPYGIDMRKIFWVKQGIITVKNMRLSRDEELVSHLLVYILLGDKVASTAENLDKIYGLDVDESKRIVNDVLQAIDKQGTEKLINLFMNVFAEIENLMAVSSKKFNELVFGGIWKRHRSCVPGHIFVNIFFNN